MVDNYMYDVKHDTEFLIGNNPEQYYSYWWDDGEPLWITATKQVRAASNASCELLQRDTSFYKQSVQAPGLLKTLT